MLNESEPQHGKKVLLPEIGIETELSSKYELVIRGEAPSLYGRTRELRGMGPVKKDRKIIPDWPKDAPSDSENFASRTVRIILNVRDFVGGTLNNTMEWAQDTFDPFGDADDNTAHGYIYKAPDGRKVREISYASGSDSNMKLFAIGHEYGELLQDEEVNNQKDLQKALDKEGIHIDVSRYWGEAFADLAGFLVLYRAKKAGDETIRIPFFRTDIENREKMGQELFGLELSIGPKPKPRGWGV